MTVAIPIWHPSPVQRQVIPGDHHHSDARWPKAASASACASLGSSAKAISATVRICSVESACASTWSRTLLMQALHMLLQGRQSPPQARPSSANCPACSLHRLFALTPRRIYKTASGAGTCKLLPALPPPARARGVRCHFQAGCKAMSAALSGKAICDTPIQPVLVAPESQCACLFKCDCIVHLVCQLRGLSIFNQDTVAGCHACPHHDRSRRSQAQRVQAKQSPTPVT